jgi:hypothetical protein
MSLSAEAKALKQEYMAKWRAANREKINAYSRQWRFDNKEKVQSYYENYWLRKVDELKRGEA